MSAAWKRWRYIRRLAHFDQMDFEFAFWQMVYLMSAPDKVFRDFGYRKRTKLQFARDDPAFLVLLSGWLLITSAGFALVMGIGFLQYVKFLLLVVFVDCLGVGAVVATLMWFLCNRYLVRGHGRVPELDPVDVEWGFCFDVHLKLVGRVSSCINKIGLWILRLGFRNTFLFSAFFPVLIVLHFVQLFFYSVLISQPWVVATLVGNLLWLVALVYYVYITFLGYNSLGILHSTKVFLYPLAPICAFILLTLALNWNLTKSLVNFYHFRLL